ncbi:MAG TPA: beta-propeller fold lactonase family protein, partial [Pyrinomonadaceae bacterium]|nr:beta-propeller fold lactonase family protein [Pyrinomonadaceae bacterium]
RFSMFGSHRRSLRLFACLPLVVFLLLPITAHGGFLYLLNDDSTGNRIYGFQVNESTGQLTLLAGFPVSAQIGGINNIVSERMTVDAANRRLYVINEGSDTVTAYSIDSTTGAISPMPFSPIGLGAGTWNTVAVHPSGSPLIVSNGATGTGASSFIVTPTTITGATGNPFLVGATSAFSSTFSRDGAYFYTGGNTGTVIAGFSVNASNGVLTALPGSPFAAGGTSTIAYATDAAGRFFGVDNAFNLRIFTTSSGVLSPTAGSPFPSGMTQRRMGLVHPNGNFYFVAGNTGNNVGVYQISGSGSATTVTAVPGSPFATGATTANVIALNRDGTYLFVGNRISRSVTTFSVNPSTGVLANLGSQASNTLGAVGAIDGIGYLPDLLIAEARIAGRVTNAGGQGIANVIIYLTGGKSATYARTNPFGYYSFDLMDTGVSYTLTPSRKGLTFTPPSITFNHVGDVTDRDFTGQ